MAGTDRKARTSFGHAEPVAAGRADHLVDGLADGLADPLAAPLRPEEGGVRSEAQRTARQLRAVAGPPAQGPAAGETDVSDLADAATQAHMAPSGVDGA